MLCWYSPGSTLLTLQDPDSNPARNSCFNCGKKKPGGIEEGKHECFLLRQITKSPPMPLILHPLQSNIRVPVSVSFPLFPPIHCNNLENDLDRQISAHAEPRHGPNVSFLPFFLSTACLYNRWGVSEAWGKEGKEKSITKFLRLSWTPSWWCDAQS